jgi:hypothetical protein
MEGITKEYFDDLIAQLATKDDLTRQTAELKAYADDKQTELAGMIERTINVSARVERLEQDIVAIKHALHI